MVAAPQQRHRLEDALQGSAGSTLNGPLSLSSERLVSTDTDSPAEDLGLTPVGSTPQEFAEGLPEQARKWRAVLREIGQVTN